MSYLPQAWQGKLFLFAGLLQEELGRLPCALVRYTGAIETQNLG